MDLLKKFKSLILIAFVFIGLAIWMPSAAIRSLMVTLDYFKEMALIIPAVFILMGLMEIWNAVRNRVDEKT